MNEQNNRVETKVNKRGRKQSVVTFPSGQFTLKEAVAANPNINKSTIYLYLNKALAAGSLEKKGEVPSTNKKGRKEFQFGPKV